MRRETFTDKRERLSDALLCRPLLTSGLFFLAVLFLLSPFSVFVRLCVVLFGLLLSLLLFVVCHRQELRKQKLFSLLALLALGAVLLSEGIGFFRVTLPNRRAETLASSGDVRLFATVREVCYRADYETGAWVILRAEEGGREFVAFSAVKAGAEVGDVFCGTATVRYREELELDTASRHRALSHGSLYEAQFQEDTVLLGKSTSLAVRFRERAFSVVDESAWGNFLRAILLGDTTRLDPVYREAFSCTGSSHLLALSGLHLSVVVLCFEGVLKRLYVGLKWRGIAVLLSGIFFLVLSGAPYSLLRAAWMLFFAFSARLLRLKTPPGTNLVLAYSMILFLDRGAMYDTGLLLSVSATLGILCIVPKVRLSFSKTRLYAFLDTTVVLRAFRAVLLAIFESFFASVCAVVFSFPVTAFCFGEVRLISPVTSLVLIPLFTVVLLVSSVFLFVGIAFGHSAFSERVLDVCCRLFFKVLLFFSDLSFAKTLIGKTFAVLLTAALLCLFVRYLRRGASLRTISLVFACFFVLVSVFGAFSLPNGYDSVTFVHDFDEEHVLFSFGGKTFLWQQTPSATADALSDACRTIGVTRIDYAFLVSGRFETERILCALAPAVEFGEIWVEEGTKHVYEPYCLASDITLSTYRTSEPITLGQITFTPFSSAENRGVFACADEVRFLCSDRFTALPDETDILLVTRDKLAEAPEGVHLWSRGVPSGQTEDVNIARFRLVEARFYPSGKTWIHGKTRG